MPVDNPLYRSRLYAMMVALGGVPLGLALNRLLPEPWALAACTICSAGALVAAAAFWKVHRARQV